MIRYDVIDEPDGGARIEQVTSFSTHGIEQGFVMTIPAEHRNAVALALLDSPSDSLTVRIDAGGAAHLRAGDGGGGCGITVPKDRRSAVALEMMGGVTDEMVERVEDAIEREHEKASLDWGVPAEDFARVAIAALFGESA